MRPYLYCLTPELENAQLNSQNKCSLKKRQKERCLDLKISQQNALGKRILRWSWAWALFGSGLHYTVAISLMLLNLQRKLPNFCSFSYDSFLPLCVNYFGFL